MRAFAIGLALALAAWSLVANLVVGDALYVVRNLVLAGGLLLLASRRGLTRHDLGLERDPLLRGAMWGGAAVVLVAVVVGLGVLVADEVGPVRRLLADQRAQIPAADAVLYALVRIPLGTVLFEEIAFRGVLLAALMRRYGTRSAVVWSSVVFGLWHIAPTMVALELNGIDPASRGAVLAIAGTVALTAAAGVIFSLLRLVSGSLLAPFLAHWATNAIGLLAAAMS
jgi:uncharacterized protein